MAPTQERITRPAGDLVIEIADVVKIYEMGSETIHALRGVSLTQCVGMTATGGSDRGSRSLVRPRVLR